MDKISVNSRRVTISSFADSVTKNLVDVNTFRSQLEFDKVVLDGTGLAFETQEFRGEYEYPEDCAVLTCDYQIGDWGFYARAKYSFE